MLILTLVRHAKSSWDDPALKDIERPLNSRGKRQARKMGEFLAGREVRPELVICSTAKRTRQTLKRLYESWREQAEIMYDRRLYLAGLDNMLALLAEAGNDYRSIMLIGHNPGIHLLASTLAATGDETELAALNRNFPTGAACAIAFDDGDWGGLRHDSGRLLLYMTPKILEMAQADTKPDR